MSPEAIKATLALIKLACVGFVLIVFGAFLGLAAAAFTTVYRWVLG